MRDLAPISISTYNRINHLKQTIESLKKNTLAKDSILYVFSDAPKNGDEDIVARVREYIHTIDGFKEVRIVEQEVNDIAKNMADAREIPLKKFGKMIRMEDDIVTAPEFLTYMNNGLDFYEKNKKIVAISGYNVPAKFPDVYVYDYYLSIYFNAWGYATWIDRGTIDIINYNDQYNEMMADKKLYKKIKKIHPKLINGLKLIQDGKLNAGDYKMVFHLMKNDLYIIKPIKSFVKNIGHDGSGVHCGVSKKFDNQIISNQKITFNKNVKYDEKIDKIYYDFFHPKISVLKRIINKLKRKLK